MRLLFGVVGRHYTANLGTVRFARQLSEGGSPPPYFAKPYPASRLPFKAMPRDDYKRCKGCRRISLEVGPLSHTRLCERCARERMNDNNDQIHVGSGPFHELRRYGIAMSEFGPDVALAMKRAGIFGDFALDGAHEHP